MATKTTAKKTVKTKRSLSKKEYDAITTDYYRLKGRVYKLAESGKLNPEAEKYLRKFLKNLEKARADINWYRATNYAAG